MISKREKQFRQKLKRAATMETPRITDPARYNQLNEQLRRAEESGDMVKQNLIMQAMAKLETGV
jgi:hypothetical protein